MTRIRGKLSLLLSIVALSCVAARPAACARLALVIGNDQYQHVASLSNAGNDARLFAKTLSDAGFNVIGGVQTNLDRKAMWTAIDQLKKRMVNGDDVVFYFAGHGVQIESNSMLLPVDIEDDNPDQLVRDGVNLYDVQDELKAAHFSLLVIDACRNDPWPPKPGRTRGLAESRGLVPVVPAEGSAIILAASRGQTALDQVPSVTTGNGLFTYDLVRAIRQPGVDVLTALRQARDQVEDQAKLVNHEQRPALVEEMRGEFVLFPVNPNLAPGKPVEDARADGSGEKFVALMAQNHAEFEKQMQTPPRPTVLPALSSATTGSVTVQIVGQCGRSAFAPDAVGRAILANIGDPRVLPRVTVKVYGGTDDLLSEGSGTSVRASGQFIVCHAGDAACPDPAPQCDSTCRYGSGSSLAINREVATDRLGEGIYNRLKSLGFAREGFMEGAVCGSN